MRSSIKYLAYVFSLLFLFVGVVVAQDLSQQKNEKINRINKIDAQIKVGASQDEYDELMKERESLVADVKNIDAKLKADVDAMNKINSVKRAYNDGNNAYKLGQSQQALDYYNKAISLDSTFYKAYYGAGLAYKKMRKWGDAAKAYQGAIRHNPTFIQAYIALGKIYSASQPDYAIRTYQQGIQNDPSSYKLYYELGAVYLNKKKDYKKAYQNFSQATQLNPEYDLAFFSLGVSLTELSRFDEAVNALEQALAVTKRKRWERPHYRLAVAYNKAGNNSAAKQAALEALKIKKKYAAASYETGKACKGLKQYQQAITYFKAAAKDRVWQRAANYEIDIIQNRDKYGLE